jgi:hypothetical protein
MHPELFLAAIAMKIVSKAPCPVSDHKGKAIPSIISGFLGEINNE